LNRRHHLEISIGLIVHREEPRIVKGCLDSLNNALERAGIVAELVCVYTHFDTSAERTEIPNNQWFQNLGGFKNLTLIPILETQNSIGFKRNLILNLAHNPLLYFTDPDVVHHQNIFSDFLVHEKDLESPNCFGLTGPYFQRSESLFINFQLKIVDLFTQWSGAAYQGTKSQKLQVDHAPCGHLMLQRNKAIELGGFDDHFAKVGEDLDFSHRMSYQKGFYSFTKASTKHQLPGLHQSYRKFFDYGRAQIRVFEKNGLCTERIYRLLPLILLLFILVTASVFQSLTLIIGLLAFCFSIVGIYSLAMLFELGHVLSKQFGRKKQLSNAET